MYSCSTVLKLQPNIDKDGGFQVIHLEKAKTKLTYPGDYWFHDFETSLFPNVHPDYLNEIKQLKSKMQFAGHTTIQPYFSTIGVLYNKKLDLKNTIGELEDDFLNRYNVSNFEQETIGTKAGDFTQVFYNLTHPKLKTQSQHIEYYGHLKDKTIRLIFWTIDSHTRSLTNESERIVKSLAMEWY
jgi:hypothetical protein